MHTMPFSFQGFQGKVGSKGDVVSINFCFSSVLTNILSSHCLLTTLSLPLLFVFPSGACRETLVLRDWLVKKVKR